MSNTVFPCRISTEDISTNAAFVCITSSDDIIRTAHSVQTLHHNNAAFMPLTSNDHCTKKSNTVFLCRESTDDISINAAFVCITSSDDIITTAHSIQALHRNKCCILPIPSSDHCSKNVQYCISLQQIH